MGICALLNIGVLLTNTLNMTLTQGFGFHLRSLFDLGWCRLNAFIAQWIRGMASWSLVIVAADRFQQSKSVTRTPTRGNHSVVYVMLGTSVLLVVLNLHYLLFTGSHVSIEGVQFLACLFYKQSNSTMQVFFAKTNTWQELGTIIIVVSITRESVQERPIVVHSLLFLAMHSHIDVEHSHHQELVYESSEQ